MLKYEITYISEDTGCCENAVISAMDESQAIREFRRVIQNDFDIISELDKVSEH